MIEQQQSQQQKFHQCGLYICNQTDFTDKYHIIRYTFNKKDRLLIEDAASFLITFVNKIQDATINDQGTDQMIEGQKQENFKCKSVDLQREGHWSQNSDASNQESEYKITEVFQLRYKIFEHFAKRGKTNQMKYSYHPLTQSFTIFMEKKWVEEQLRMSPVELIKVVKDFQYTWLKKFYPFLINFLRYYTCTANKQSIKMIFKAIDIISFTFDLKYQNCDKIFRYIYSPFEFVLCPIFSNRYSQMGIYQEFSCLILDQRESHAPLGEKYYEEFYECFRLPFLDSLVLDRVLFHIISRTNFLYQVYSVANGLYASESLSQSNMEFKKKCFGSFYATFKGFKNILLTWRMQIPTNKTETEASQKEEAAAAMLLIISIAIQDPEQLTTQEQTNKFRAKITILDSISNKTFSHPTKKKIGMKIAELINIFNESRIGPNFPYLIQAELQLYTQKEQNDYELTMTFFTSDRNELFFTGLIGIVTDILNHNMISRHNEAKFQIRTNEWFFANSYENTTHHQMCMLEVQYEEQRLMSAEAMKRSDINEGSIYRFGQWKFIRANRIQRVVKMRNKKNRQDPQTISLNWDQFYLDYFNILLKNFPYHIVHTYILKFSQVLARYCYKCNDRTKVFKKTQIDLSLKTILKVLLDKLYSQLPNMRSHILFPRVPIFILLSPNTPGYNPDKKPLIQVTYRTMQFINNSWIVTEHEGTHIIRIFKAKLDYQFEGRLIASNSFEIKRGSELKQSLVKSLLRSFAKDDEPNIDHLPF